MRRRHTALGITGLFAGGARASELRFPPPDFEGGHVMPETLYPPARMQGLEYLDAAVLLAGLALAVWLVHRRRSRAGILGLSAFSLLYFGFYREGCVCAIGSVQNVALALGGDGYGLPLAVGVFFAAPLVVALFFGRAFCAAVCPHGALQDLALVRPVEVPKWLEHGLGVVPFLFLGAGVAFAATGAAFVICRYDPFVPIFRMTGGMGMVLAGGVFVAVSLFVGRPYCRFVCPFGALLRMASALSRWRVRITPDTCTQCRLCSGTCPFGVIQPPDAALTRPKDLGQARRRMRTLIVVLPLWVAAGAGIGWVAGAPAARLHPTVRLAEQYGLQLSEEARARLLTAERLALTRAETQASQLVPQALELRARFRKAGLGFGAWSGLVLGIKLLSLGMARRRTEFEPDRSGCFGCARCFSSCPQERLRLGLEPLAVPGSGAPAGCGGSGGGENASAASVLAAGAVPETKGVKK